MVEREYKESSDFWRGYEAALESVLDMKQKLSAFYNSKPESERDWSFAMQGQELLSQWIINDISEASTSRDIAHICERAQEEKQADKVTTPWS